MDRITAFLFHRGGNENPDQLLANQGQSFFGTKIYGAGFTFDDDRSKANTTSLSLMETLIGENPEYKEVVFPYIGGAEVNSSPEHKHHRYVINFGEMGEQEARDRYPELLAIVEEKVKPERMTNRRPIRRRYWWRFGETTPGLFAAIADLDRVIVICRIGQHAAFAFLPGGMVYAESLIVFPLDTYAAFCALQARPHEIWARFFGSSMKDDLRYTSSDCFETYPFPVDWQHHPHFEAAGQTYYDHRATVMIENDEGLTETYNRFHDPHENDLKIVELRRLHAEMDRAVLDAYGWSDIPTECEFLLDYEIDEDNWSPRKKKPYRYRWPDDVHDEVLGRLLELNAERAEEEKRSAARRSQRPAKKSTSSSPSSPTLFEMTEQE